MGGSGRSRSHDSEEICGGGTGSADNNLENIGVDVVTGGERVHVESTRARFGNGSVRLR